MDGFPNHSGEKTCKEFYPNSSVGTMMMRTCSRREVAPIDRLGFVHPALPHPTNAIHHSASCRLDILLAMHPSLIILVLGVAEAWVINRHFRVFFFDWQGILSRAHEEKPFAIGVQIVDNNDQRRKGGERRRCRYHYHHHVATTIRSPFLLRESRAIDANKKKKRDQPSYLSFFLSFWDSVCILLF